MRPVLADAAEVARRALVELEPDGVGVHLGVTAEDETAATHRFEATLAGYRGWQWAVVVAAPPEATYATVSESALLPGPDALIAPDFVPWEQRVRPGDLGPGDLLAPPADDPRLVPGYVATGDPVVDEVAREVGLGRTQVLSLEGRTEAAERWYAEFGPDTEMAKAAPSTCGLCGFYLPLAGALRDCFGVCGNAMGADGHVVHVEYGCGAHSDVVAPSGNGSPRYEAFDDHAVDYVEITRTESSAEGNGSAENGAGEVTGEAAEPTADPVVADAGEITAARDSAEPTDAQETAEAEAVEAAAVERAALAEGAQPESASEVIAAESATSAAEAPTSTEAPAADAGSAIDGASDDAAPANESASPTTGAEANGGTATVDTPAADAATENDGPTGTAADAVTPGGDDAAADGGVAGAATSGDRQAAADGGTADAVASDDDLVATADREADAATPSVDAAAADDSAADAAASRVDGTAADDSAADAAAPSDASADADAVAHDSVDERGSSVAR